MTSNNKLTLLRLVATPLLILLLYNNNTIISFVLFCSLALTDIFDGYVARKKNQGTKFGIIFDSLSDKIFSIMILLFFINTQIINSFNLVPIYIIIARELFVSNMRILADGKMKSNIVGKVKTVVLDISIGSLILFMHFYHPFFQYIGLTLINIACVLSLISAFPYFVLFKKFI